MGPQIHIFVIFLVIIFSYYFHIFVYAWAGPPVHSAIFEMVVYLDLECRESQDPEQPFWIGGPPAVAKGMAKVSKRLGLPKLAGG